MNSKILIAFAAGALLASGIVYMAVKDDLRPKIAAAPVAIPLPAPPEAPVAKAPEPVVVIPPAIPPVRQKPSPMPAPVRREKPIVVAVRHDPPPQPAPEPVQEVAEKQPDPKPQVEAQIPNEPPPAPPPAEDPALPSEPMPEVRTPHTVTIAAGTFLPVRIGETLSASRNRRGDGFLATLDRPLVVDGFVIAERGSRVEGRVVEAMKGESRLEIELVKLSTADGQHIQIRTEAFRKQADSSAGSDVAKIGIGAALGAAIGGAAAGGKGAAIGAGAGAAAGVAGVALSRRTAEIPVETRIRFRMSDPVTIIERLN